VTRDEEVRQVIADLDALLAGLESNVEALRAVLNPDPPAAAGTDRKAAASDPRPR